MTNNIKSFVVFVDDNLKLKVHINKGKHGVDSVWHCRFELLGYNQLINYKYMDSRDGDEVNLSKLYHMLDFPIRIFLLGVTELHRCTTHEPNINALTCGLYNKGELKSFSVISTSDGRYLISAFGWSMVLYTDRPYVKLEITTVNGAGIRLRYKNLYSVQSKLEFAVNQIRSLLVSCIKLKSVIDDIYNDCFYSDL